MPSHPPDAARRVLLEAMPIAAVETDGEGVILSHNAEWAARMRRPGEDFVGTNVFDLMDPEAISPRQAALQRVLAAKKAIQFEDDLGFGVYAVRVTPLLDAQGGVSSVIVTLADIQPDREREAELRRTSQRLNDIVDATSDGLYYWSFEDAESSTMWWSPHLFEMLGYEPNAFVPNLDRFAAMVHPDDREQLMGESLRRSLSRKGVFEADYRIQNRNGHYLWVRARGQTTFDGEDRPIRIAGSLRDITDERTRFESLRIREQHYRTMFNVPGDMLFLRRADESGPFGPFLDVNETACRCLGYTLEEMKCMTPEDLAEEPSQPRVLLSSERLPDGTTATLHERTLRKKDGTSVDVEIHRRPFREGEDLYVISVARDITTRRAAEAALREAEDRWSRLLENVRLLAVILDESGRVNSTNPFVSEVLGWTPDELLGMPWIDFVVDAPDRESVREIFDRTLESGRFPRLHENAVRTASGQSRMVRWHNTALRDSSGRIVASASLGEDVTELRRAQQEAETSRERLRLLASRLSEVERAERHRFATILHDEISQELVFLRMQVAKALQTAESPTREQLDAVQRQLGQTLNLTRDLIQDVSPPALYELGLEPALAALLERMGEQHDLTHEFRCDEPERSYRGEIAQTIYAISKELLTNAVRHSQASCLTVVVQRTETLLRVEVIDDGVGFPARESQTDDPRSTGFGLFSIRERLRELGGTLSLIPGEPGGTIARVEVPLVAPAEATATEPT